MALVLTNTKPAVRAGSLLYPAVHYVQGETPLAHISAAGGTGTISWTDNDGGIFTPATGAAVDYQPPNKTKTQTVVASAATSGGSGSTLVTVIATFPLQPQVGYEIDLDDETRVEFMRDRTAYFQVEGPSFEDRPLAFIDRESDERATLEAFWDFHRKTKQFFYIDVETLRTYLCRFTSGVKTRVAGADSYDMTCTISGNLT